MCMFIIKYKKKSLIKYKLIHFICELNDIFIKLINFNRCNKVIDKILKKLQKKTINKYSNATIN